MRKEDKLYCVYMHRNKVNGKVYIGRTSQNLNRRWRNGDGYKNCSLFWEAIQKYGWDSFEHIIIASNLSLEEADQMEKDTIEKFNAMDEKCGYNIREGGLVAKISEETKKKLSEAHLGKTLSEETKTKISESLKGESNPFWNKHHTDETKAKISKIHKGKKIPKEVRKRMSESHFKPVRCVETGKEYPSIKEAARQLNLHEQNINACCKGRVKTTGGLHFEYV